MVLDRILNSSKTGYGFDAYKEEYCDMISSGIVDPTKVTRSALENASSVSSILLTTEACVADKPEPPAPAPAIWAVCTNSDGFPQPILQTYTTPPGSSRGCF